MKPTNNETAGSLEPQKLVDELHSYTRHNISIFVQWFTFFLTVNYLALGWFASSMAKGEISNKKPLIYVSILFAIQGILGTIGSLIWQEHIGVVKAKLLKLYGDKLGATLGSVLPHDLYRRAVQLCCVAMVVVICVWMVFAFK
jgi:hypothetical protein